MLRCIDEGTGNGAACASGMLLQLSQRQRWLAICAMTPDRRRRIVFCRCTSVTSERHGRASSINACNAVTCTFPTLRGYVSPGLCYAGRAAASVVTRARGIWATRCGELWLYYLVACDRPGRAQGWCCTEDNAHRNTGWRADTAHACTRDWKAQCEQCLEARIKHEALALHVVVDSPTP